MLRRKLVPLMALLIGFCQASLCWAETGVTDKEIQIGASHALTGQNAVAGHETDVGINCCINDVNRKGGVCGRKIRVVNCDDKYEPDGAIACFQYLVQQGIFAITGIYGSGTSARYIPMAMSNKIPIVGFHNGTNFVTNPTKRYIFSARCSYREEIRQSVDHLWKAGLRRFAIIYQNDAYGADCFEGLKIALDTYGATPVAAASYTRNKTDVKDAVNDVKKANPQIVFLGAVYKPSAEIVKLAKEMNWNPQFVLNTGSSVTLFVPEAGPAAAGTVYSECVPLPTDGSVRLVRTFLNALKEYYPDEKPTYEKLRAYLGAVVLVEGLKRAGKDLTREGFVNAMEGIHNLDVGLGKGMALNYSSTDHMGFNKVFFGTIKNGQAVSFNNWAKVANQNK
jgi:ABC-type branched-subunit amino acid transport system substrate-binding protein